LKLLKFILSPGVGCKSILGLFHANELELKLIGVIIDRYMVADFILSITRMSTKLS